MKRNFVCYILLTSIVVGAMMWLREKNAATVFFANEQLPSDQRIITPLAEVSEIDWQALREQFFFPLRQQTFDLELAADLRFETAPLLAILTYLWTQNKNGSALPVVDESLTYEQLVNERYSEKFFAEPLAFSGAAMAAQEMKISPPVKGIDRLYLLTVTDVRLQNQPRSVWTCAVLNLPVNLRRGDLLAISGVFIKKLPVQDARRQWQWSPLIAAANITVIPLLSPFTQSAFGGKLIIGVVALLFITAIIAGWFLLRSDADYFHRLRYRKKNDRHE